jgi:dCTP deaminase
VKKLTFISKEEIKKRCSGLIKENKLIEEDFSKSGASYDLRLGEEVLVTPQKVPQRLEYGETTNIESGQFAILTTEEYLQMPKDLLGFITVRFRYKSKGLVNISGFHVDPGFEGKLIFSVYNAGPTTVTLRRGETVFSIFFAEIDPKVEYKGDYSKQVNIPIDIVETFAGARVPSLQALENRVNRNWAALKIYGTILTGLVVTLLGVIISRLLGI